MKQKTIYFLASLVFVLTGIHTDTYSNDVESHFLRNTHNRYFPLHMNVRSMGMGGTFVAIPGDSASVLGNPAGLGGLANPFLSGAFQYEQISGDDLSTLNSVDEDLYQGLVLGAYPVTPEFTLGLGFVPSFSDAEDAGDWESENYYIPLDLAYAIHPQLSLGYGFGYVNDDVSAQGLDGEMDAGFLHRLGGLYKVTEALHFGLMGTFGHGDAESSSVTGMNFDGEREAWGVQGGVSWLATTNLLLALDLSFEEMETDGAMRNSLIPGFTPATFDETLEIITVRGGGEYALNEKVDLRSGVGFTDYEYETSDPTTANLVGSLDGFHLSGGIGYAWSDAVSTDLSGRVRFMDETDFILGVQFNYQF